MRKSYERTFYLRADSLCQSLSEAFRAWREAATLLGVEEPTTEFDALLESIKGMDDAVREALLSALGVLYKGKRSERADRGRLRSVRPPLGAEFGEDLGNPCCSTSPALR